MGLRRRRKRDEDGRDLKVGSFVKTPAQSGVPNRAEQLAGHGRAWNGTAWLRADVTSCYFLQLVREKTQGKKKEDSTKGI